MNIKKTIKKAISAIEKEIEAVRETPSNDVLTNGVLQKQSESHIYVFETTNQGLRFAEEIRAKLRSKELEVHEIDFKEGKVWLDFPEDFGPTIDEVYLEWENDFVLKKMEEHLYTLEDKYEKVDQLKSLLEPAKHFKENSSGYLVKVDELRNDSQPEAIEKAVKNNVLYVWGPPGTGKTATLGFIVANLLREGKRVLFVSNTNRAVDVGLMNVIEALYEIEPMFDLQQTTRFGEAALQDDRLESILFENQVKIKLDGRKADAVQLSTSLENYKKLQAQIDKMMLEDEEIPQKLDLECQLLGEKVDREGGIDAMEEKIDKLLNLNERYELKKKQLVATTMAKVCT